MRPKMIENAPALDLDKVLYKHGPVPPHIIRERRIVWNLLKHLIKAGFKPINVDDGGETTHLSNVPMFAMKEAMELIFNLDEAHVLFLPISKLKPKAIAQWVFLVLGNDLDVVSDWSLLPKGRDDFNAAMELFNAE